MPEEERLHKYLARCGVASRRKAETFIVDGRVSVNGAVVTILGTKVGPLDEVAVDGVPVKPERLLYVLMNKPKGVLTTLSDPQRRPTVKQILPDLGVTLKPVGRLDMDSEGLILFTNDGEFAQSMAHARHGIEKEYDATVLGDIDDKDLDRMRRGIMIDGRRTGPAYVEKVGYDAKSNRSRLRVILREGRNRQVRRLADAVGHPVEELKRVRIGHLVLKKLRSSECVLLGKVDIDRLREAAAPADPSMVVEEVPGAEPRPRPVVKRRPTGGGTPSRRPKPPGEGGEGTVHRKPPSGAKR
ncbi:MAG TPA: pseudouridine synthase, partial [Fimbriimonadaceae bacterium]|nr:pseudouridine synthase [Fimbriimonadaceae bacterium]